jgi:hypothetical protein
MSMNFTDSYHALSLFSLPYQSQIAPPHYRRARWSTSRAIVEETPSHIHLGCSHVPAAERPSLLNKLRRHVNDIATVTVRETISFASRCVHGLRTTDLDFQP